MRPDQRDLILLSVERITTGLVQTDLQATGVLTASFSSDCNALNDFLY